MSEKKKDSAAKTTDKGVEQAQSKNTQVPAVAVSANSGAAALPRRITTEEQLQSFQSGMKLFHARKFQEARAWFLQAASGPERDVAHRAQLHASICDRRLEQQPVELRTAEDHYNYAIALLNTRKVEEARTHLERALELAPSADHIHYALAVARTLAGDAGGAYEHLRQAIALEPRNRIMARQDADLAPILGQPQFQALLYPEKKSR